MLLGRSNQNASHCVTASPGGLVVAGCFRCSTTSLRHFVTWSAGRSCIQSLNRVTASLCQPVDSCWFLLSPRHLVAWLLVGWSMHARWFTVSLCHLVTWSLGRLVVWLSLFLTASLGHLVTWSFLASSMQAHCVTWSPGHLVTWSPGHSYRAPVGST